MSPVEPGADDTIRILRARRRKRARWPLIAVATASIGLAGTTAVWLLRPHEPPPISTRSAPSVVAPAFRITSATEGEINEHVATALTVFRLADNPRILVLDFASLLEQGKMLNRVAAFVEKGRLPRDRVMSDAEMDAAIRAQGDTAETFYLGHDYAAAALARFFAAADRQQIQLHPQEETLRALLRQEGWLAPDVAAGLISLPAVGSDPRITPSARLAILRHELSHGEFFSDPIYAQYVHDFWMMTLTEKERASVRTFLARDDYDVRQEELVFNEMQAYLMFTRDPLFFRPELAGLTQERLVELQTRFMAGMPAGWLRDVMASYQASAIVQ